MHKTPEPLDVDSMLPRLQRYLAFGKPPSTGRDLKNVPIAASTPPQGREEALKFLMKSSCRKRKRALVDNQNENLRFFFGPYESKLFIQPQVVFFLPIPGALAGGGLAYLYAINTGRL